MTIGKIIFYIKINVKGIKGIPFSNYQIRPFHDGDTMEEMYPYISKIGTYKGLPVYSFN